MNSKPRIVIGVFLCAALLCGCNEGDKGAGQEEVGALQELDDGRAPVSKPLPTVESRLENVVDAWHDTGLSGALTKARDLSLPVEGSRLRVVFVAQAGLADHAADSLRRAGCAVSGRFNNLIEALVRPDEVEPLSLTPGILWVRPPLLALPMVTSQGVAASAADTWQETAPFGGSDRLSVNVGVIDLGFQGYSSLVGRELPPNTEARSFRDDGSIEAGERHGTAVAEIVYDMAPSAGLTLATIDSEVDLSNAVNFLINKGVSVICHSVGWFNAGPGDGTGVIDDIVSRATSRNIAWVNAAGNEAETHWEGVFTSPDGDGYLDFAPGDETNSFRALAGEDIWVLMNWKDWPRSANDYDLQLYFETSGGLELVGESASVQNGSQEPTEAISYSVPQGGTYHIAVFKHPSAAALRVEIFVISEFGLQYPVPAGSIVVPADHPDVVAVGAAHWGLKRIESYSSRGPTTDGRTKPDVTGYDGVLTSTYSPLAFWGTSAAAPHVAGALALMQTKIGAAYSMDQLEQILLARSRDQGTAGFDNTYGRGLLYMLP